MKLIHDMNYASTGYNFKVLIYIVKKVIVFYKKYNDLFYVLNNENYRIVEVMSVDTLLNPLKFSVSNLKYALLILS